MCVREKEEMREKVHMDAAVSVAPSILPYSDNIHLSLHRGMQKKGPETARGQKQAQGALFQHDATRIARDH